MTSVDSRATCRAALRAAWPWLSRSETVLVVILFSAVRLGMKGCSAGLKTFPNHSADFCLADLGKQGSAYIRPVRIWDYYSNSTLFHVLMPTSMIRAIKSCLPKRVFNKFGSLSKSGFQAHPPFLSNQGYAPTLTLPRRERELIKHPLR